MTRPEINFHQILANHCDSDNCVIEQALKKISNKAILELIELKITHVV